MGEYDDTYDDKEDLPWLITDLPIAKHGEIICEATYKRGRRKGLRCDNNAYHMLCGIKLCGIHIPRKGIVYNQTSEDKTNDLIIVASSLVKMSTS